MDEPRRPIVLNVPCVKCLIDSGGTAKVSGVTLSEEQDHSTTCRLNKDVCKCVNWCMPGVVGQERDENGHHPTCDKHVKKEDDYPCDICGSRIPGCCL